MLDGSNQRHDLQIGCSVILFLFSVQGKEASKPSRALDTTFVLCPMLHHHPDAKPRALTIGHTHALKRRVVCVQCSMLPWHPLDTGQKHRPEHCVR